MNNNEFVEQDDVVTGFYKESGLFIKCPNCHTSLKYDVSTLFSAIYQGKIYECDKCKKFLSINLLVQVVGNYEIDDEGEDE